MQEIKCPKCGEVFAVDQTGYAQILNQVRDKEFERELGRREKSLVEKQQSDLELERIKQQKKFNQELLAKEDEIKQLKARLENGETEKKLAVSEAVGQKEEEREKELQKKNEQVLEQAKLIEELKAKIENGQNEKMLAVSEAVGKKDAEREKELQKKNDTLLEQTKLIEELKAKIENGQNEKLLAVSEAVGKKDAEREKELQKKTDELLEQTKIIEELKAKLENGETEKKLAVSEALQKKDHELNEKSEKITELKNQLSTKEMELELNQKSLKEKYEDKLKQKDELIEYYKDFKARQSTKMVGESLEQHCLNQFNSLRMTAFQNAYFEKDNDARTGSKGDFIFRESSDGVEFISIMFEMKNEMDETATKHKNEDFLKELDKDRREKGCEYAVLVSLLEIDNELYNNGIVDVSYKYDKMYVIRPQFFIPMITLLRNAALNSLQYQRELAVVKNQQIDIVHFEENMNSFKEGFARNYRLASEKFNKAIEEIDKTISHLQKTKEALLSSENNLRLANNKAEDLSIKKLTKNAPSVREMYEEEKQNLQECH